MYTLSRTLQTSQKYEAQNKEKKSQHHYYQRRETHREVYLSDVRVRTDERRVQNPGNNFIILQLIGDDLPETSDEVLILR